MFNLNQAPEGIRKAAAWKGIKSGKFETVHNSSNLGWYAAPIAKVYNRNHPEGIVIRMADSEQALNYTWKEINSR